MQIKILRTNEDYLKALERLNEVFDAPASTPDGDEAEVLALLVEDYENRNYPIDLPDPIEAIKIRMEELELKQVDLVADFGGKNRASEVLNKKRVLTIVMIRKLSKRLNLSINILSREYQLE